VATSTELFVWGAGDVLRRYDVLSTGLKLSLTGPTARGALPGGELTLSANGAVAGSAVPWVSQPLTGNASQSTVQGILQAFDARDASKELRDSLPTPGDDCGAFAKFASRAVANGKVYLASFSNQICVYGLE
jgi:hypothetical protein